MRATVAGPRHGRLMGIDTDKIIVVTFALGGALAGVAGVIQGIRFTQIDFRIGFVAGIKAFTAAVLGGIGNIRGAVLGGFVHRDRRGAGHRSTSPRARPGRTCGPSSCSSSC